MSVAIGVVLGRRGADGGELWWWEKGPYEQRRRSGRRACVCCVCVSMCVVNIWSLHAPSRKQQANPFCPVFFFLFAAPKKMNVDSATDWKVVAIAGCGRQNKRRGREGFGAETRTAKRQPCVTVLTTVRLTARRRNVGLGAGTLGTCTQGPEVPLPGGCPGW